MSKNEYCEGEALTLVDWENRESPFYTATHKKWRRIVKSFVEREVLPNIDRWEKQGNVPRELYRKAYEAGVYAHFYPKEMGGTPFETLEHDPFAVIIWYEQFCRSGSGGLITTLMVHGIAVPPIVFFGTPKQKAMFKEVVMAKKFACLAISETTAGSDVRNLATVAKKDPKDGDYYIVNGSKYWISGALKADYFVTAVRTGKAGIGGISLMIIPRQKGVVVTRIPLMGHAVSDTGYVVFRNVRVHKDMIIGAENQGFMVIMYNFNTERIGICMEAICFARTCIEEAARYAKTRKTFGRLLIKHQVIRHKLAEMSRQVLAAYSFLETVSYQVAKDPQGMKDRSIARNMALLKVCATKTLEYCAREACQIFGGRSYVRGGRAAKVERIYRDVRAFAIYGGSEEIMLDLAIRQARL